MGHDMVVLRYAIPTGISCVDGFSTGPLGFGASHPRDVLHEMFFLRCSP